MRDTDLVLRKGSGGFPKLPSGFSGAYLNHTRADSNILLSKPPDKLIHDEIGPMGLMCLHVDEKDTFIQDL